MFLPCLFGPVPRCIRYQQSDPKLDIKTTIYTTFVAHRSITMSERKGGKIIDMTDLTVVEAQGEASRKAREKAKEQRDMNEVSKKMAEDSGTESKTRRGKGV